MFDSSADAPNRKEADELKFVLLNQLVTQKVSDTFKANKHDYNTFDKALAYVKELLRDHYDNSHPTPMNIDAIAPGTEGEKEKTQTGNGLWGQWG